MLIGYARVSTAQQETALQLAALRQAGVSRVIEEKRSSGASRPLLDRLLADLQPGDEVIVYKIDRLARSLVDLLRILARIDAAGATFRSLTEPIETRTPVGRMMLQLLGAVAEFERAVIRERCAAGRVEALARGVWIGRRPSIARADVLRLVEQGRSIRQAADELGISITSAKRIAAGLRRCDGGPGEPRPSKAQREAKGP